MRDFDSIKQKEMGSIENRVRHVYNRGYEDGYKDGRENIIDTYDAGLDDAWECARKIAKDVCCGGLTQKDLEEIFGNRFVSEILKDNTASEAIAKIKAWEEGQEMKIKVGDEILCSGTNDKAIVTKVINGLEGDLYRCVHSDGDLSTETSESKPTGRFFPEIAEVLRKIQEGEE